MNDKVKDFWIKFCNEKKLPTDIKYQEKRISHATSSKFLSALCPNTAAVYIVAIVINPLVCKHLTKVASTFCA